MNERHDTTVRNHGISIILPALNEEKNLTPLVAEIIDYFSTAPLPCEIIIVNDGSTDATGIIADGLASTHKNILVIHHTHNKGYGKSLKDGFNASRHEYLFFTDTDRQFKIKSFDAFLPLMKEGNADMIIGFRIGRKDNLLRKFLAWCFNRVVCTLFFINAKDIDCAFKLFKKEIVSSLEIKADNFLFNAELLAKARIKQLTIIQVGVIHYPRVEGASTISCKSILSVLKKLYSLHQEIRDFKKK